MLQIQAAASTSSAQCEVSYVHMSDRRTPFISFVACITFEEAARAVPATSTRMSPACAPAAAATDPERSGEGNKQQQASMRDEKERAREGEMQRQY